MRANRFDVSRWSIAAKRRCAASAPSSRCGRSRAATCKSSRSTRTSIATRRSCATPTTPCACRRARRRSRRISTTICCSRRCARSKPTRCGRDGASWPSRRSSSTASQRAGMRFLGPSGDTMRRLGDKIASKELAERSACRSRRGAAAPLRDAAHAGGGRERIGLPLVLKASAGGGGRGIRIDRGAGAAAGAVSVRRLRGAGRVRRRPDVPREDGARRPPHRSADRRRPARLRARARLPRLLGAAPPPEGDRRGAAARAAAAAARGDAGARPSGWRATVGYAGVGTVEFLVEEAAHFYFLEMNPRLQVEHGITEEITGARPGASCRSASRAANARRACRSREPACCIEARVCAEDPDAGFLPAPGRIARFDPALGPHLRVDTGVVLGSVVPSAFDSLIAKVMARGATRDAGRARLRAALRDFDLVIEGGATNKGYLLEVLETRGLQSGRRRHAAGSIAGTCSARHGRRTLPRRSCWRRCWRTARRGRAERRNFFSDTSTITPDKVPAVEGRELDLEYRGAELPTARVLGRVVALPRAPRGPRDQRPLRRGRAAHRARRDRRPLLPRHLRRDRCVDPSRDRRLRASFRSPDGRPGSRRRTVDGGVDRRRTRPARHRGTAPRAARGDEDGDRLCRAGRRRGERSARDQGPAGCGRRTAARDRCLARRNRRQ